ALIASARTSFREVFLSRRAALFFFSVGDLLFGGCFVILCSRARNRDLRGGCLYCRSTGRSIFFGLFFFGLFRLRRRCFASARLVDLKEGLPDGNSVPWLDENLGHLSRFWRGEPEGRLLAFQLHYILIGLNCVPLGDQQLAHFRCFDILANFGQLHLNHVVVTG